MTKAKRPRGRPREAVPAKAAEEIIDVIADGKPLREHCRQEGKPKWRTVYHWLEKDPDFVARFAHAREMGGDAIAEKALELADEEPPIVDGKVDAGHVAWKRLQIDTRLKLLAKWNPKKYGDKVALEHGGGLTLNVVTGVVDPK